MNARCRSDAFARLFHILGAAGSKQGDAMARWECASRPPLNYAAEKLFLGVCLEKRQYF